MVVASKKYIALQIKVVFHDFELSKIRFSTHYLKNNCFAKFLLLFLFLPFNIAKNVVTTKTCLIF